MRWTQSLIPTQKQNPADAQIVSHQLMIRAGLIRQLAAGAYDFLPLGLRALRKTTEIVRQEMDAIGCAEILLPSLQPIELWQKTGRDLSYGENLMTSTDRHGRRNVLGPTHEEVVTELVAANINSYKQLPLALYQIQTKFRDEYRPRFGLLRVREFLMKDAYSFHADIQSLDAWYDRFYAAYQRIFRRCGIPFVVVEAESGPIGGSASHEFMAACAAGEDLILTSDRGNYAANVEKCAIGPRPHTFAAAPTGALETVHTPNLPSIDEVGQFMQVQAKHMLKTLVFQATGVPALPGEPRANRWVVAVVRGDHEVNEAKLAHAAGETFNIAGIQLTDSPEVRSAWSIGFVSPAAAIANPQAVLIVDPDAAQGGFWAAGADTPDHHVKHFNWFRECGEKLADPTKTLVADIRNAVEGDPSPMNDGGTLKTSRGIEIGHVFKLGTKYSDALGARFSDERQQEQSILMGCYGIGIGRILIAAIESLHDDRGIIWPAAIAPFSVVITPIQYAGAVQQTADQLYAALNTAGIDAILDDRDARPGSKFADADLIGFPIRITIGDRGLSEGKVEIKARKATEPQMVEVGNAVGHVRDLLKGL